MNRKQWSLLGACMFLAITLIPATPSSAVATVLTTHDGCARGSVAADQTVTPVAHAWAGAEVAVPLDPAADPLDEECRSEAGLPEVFLAPEPEVDPCTEDAARTRATARAPGLALDAVAPVGTPCADPDLGIPGPLVVSFYWNGTGPDMEWVYQGSFDCVLISGYHWDFRVECTPLDVANFHCVNPGVAATYSGLYYVRRGTRLECGDISGQCWTPWGSGACSSYLGGVQQALVVCEGIYDLILGGSGSGSQRVTGTCYSDPPELPPRESIYPGEIPVVESFVRV